MDAVIVAAGDLSADAASQLAGAELVIAADAGALGAERLGRRPDVLVGDLDSLDAASAERLAEAGARVERHPADKDASDTALAIDAARAAGASRLIVLGGIGGERLDHTIANLLLLAGDALDDVDTSLVHGRDTVRVIRGGQTLSLDGVPGDLVSLLPVGGRATGVTTTGLRWPLDGADLPMGTTRGLSNVISTAPASVRVDGGSLFVIHRSQAGGTSR